MRIHASTNRRLFVALWPDESVRTGLVQVRDRWDWSASARPTPSDHLHVTLVFLGAVATDRIPLLIDALPIVFEPFTLRFGRSTLWGNGIAALEPTHGVAPLIALQAVVSKRTAALGIPGETRAYRPHVTLARDAAGSTSPQNDDALVWPVVDYALIESRGGRYTTVATWKAGRTI